jgi:anti-sigma factor RsiW
MATEPWPSNDDCPQWRLEAAVYVLGALSPGERHRFERHLLGCTTCRDELVWLAGLRGLLARLTEAEALGLAAPRRPGVPGNEERK